MERRRARIVTIFVAISLIWTMQPFIAENIKGEDSSMNDIVLVRCLDSGNAETLELLSSVDVQILETYERFVLVDLTLEERKQLLKIGLEIIDLPDRTITGRGAYIFDTLKGEPWIPEHLKINQGDMPHYNAFIVQFIGPIKKNWIDSLSSIGVEFHDYLPSYSFIVTMNPSLVQQINNLRFVQWVGLYHPAYKIAPSLLFSGEEIMDTEISILPGKKSDRVSKIIDENGGIGKGKWDCGSKSILRAEMPADLLSRIAQLPEIEYLESSFKTKAFNDVATWIVQSNDPNAGRSIHNHGIHGQNQIVTIADSGLFEEHEVFSDSGKVIDYYIPDGYLPGEPTPTLGDEIGHGTHVAGTIVGDAPDNGIYGTYNKYDGHAFEAGIIVQDIGNEDDFYLPNDFNNLFQPSYDAGSRIHSNSWGGVFDESYPFDYYTTGTASIDEFMRTNPDFLIIFAAGNERYTSISQVGVAKNIITVGGSKNQNEMYTSSSRGPAMDGRLKPTLLAPGVGICSAMPSYEVNDYYCELSGTSTAAPAVAGSAALIRQYFLDGWYPSGIPDSGNEFEPSAALIKAMLVNSATEIFGRDAYGEIEEQSYVAVNNIMGYSQPPCLESMKDTDSAPARAYSPSINFNYENGYRFEMLFYLAEGEIQKNMIVMEDGRAHIMIPFGDGTTATLRAIGKDRMEDYSVPQGQWLMLRIDYSPTSETYDVYLDPDSYGNNFELIAEDLQFLGNPWQQVAIGTPRFTPNPIHGTKTFMGQIFYDSITYKRNTMIYFLDFFDDGDISDWHVCDGKDKELRYPNNHQGWGLINLENVLYFNGDARKLSIHDDTEGFTESGQSWQYEVQVLNSLEPFEVSLVWTDSPGVPGASKSLVNDLDLLIEDPQGNLYRGNIFSGWGPDNPGQSVTGGEYDSINVEEGVLRYSPSVGEWKITVTAKNIANGPQPFAIVATGAIMADHWELYVNDWGGSGVVPNFWEYTNQFGVGFHIDSNGTYKYDFDFMGLTKEEFTIGSTGSITISGYFSFWDNFGTSYPHYRIAEVFVVDASTFEYLARVRILDNAFERGTWYHQTVMICNEDLTPGTVVRIGVGRSDWWQRDWKLTVECAGLIVDSIPEWSAHTIPSGYGVNFEYISTDYGKGGHVDSFDVNNWENIQMMGLAETLFVIGPGGLLHVKGYFSLSDNFLPNYPHYRVVYIYVLNSDGSVILTTTDVAEEDWENGVFYYVDVIIQGLQVGQEVRLGIGRSDCWIAQWQLVAEWAGVCVTSTENW